MNEVAEKLKMGLDTKKSFAQMYGDGNMNKGVWGWDDEVGSRNNTGVQKRNQSKKDLILAQNREEIQQSRPYSHTDGRRLAQDAIGLRILVAKSPA